jgi:hypothetical protein
MAPAPDRPSSLGRPAVSRGQVIRHLPPPLGDPCFVSLYTLTFCIRLTAKQLVSLHTQGLGVVLTALESVAFLARASKLCGGGGGSTKDMTGMPGDRLLRFGADGLLLRSTLRPVSDMSTASCGRLGLPFAGVAAVFVPLPLILSC